MGKVIDMPTGKQRDSIRRRIKQERRKELRTRAAAGLHKGAPGRFFRVLMKGLKRVLLSMLSVSLSTLIGLLEGFHRPIRWLFRLIVISMIFAIGAQYKNNWSDLQMTFYAVFTVLFTIGALAFYNSFLNSLRNMKYRLNNRRSTHHA
ncbi:TPA: hypothetical protein MN540_005038 [Klebsiella pneumoniae]|nr:hypothetical protein [Klebsiella pneumoniae]